MLTDTEIKREKAYELYVSKKFQASIEVCITALVGSPWQSWVYYLLGLNELALGRRREALASLTRYTDLDKSTFSTTRRKAMAILAELASGN